MRARLARMHQREADGSLKPLPDFELPQEPEVHMGGHGLYGTVGDYCRFIRMWLNDGAGEHGRVLKPETVRMAVQNGLGDKKVKLSARGHRQPVQRRRVLPRPLEVLGAHLHDQRRARPHRPPRRRPGLGRPPQPVLLDRPPERHRRLLGHPGLPLRRPGRRSAATWTSRPRCTAAWRCRRRPEPLGKDRRHALHDWTLRGVELYRAGSAS